MKRIVQSIALAAVLAIAGAPMFARSGNLPLDLADQVRHELVMIPYYGVFDNLNYAIDEGVVTLSGEVILPVVKDDAERSVKRLPGVTKVINNIRVLPLSSFDNRIRRAEYVRFLDSPACIATRWVHSPRFTSLSTTGT